MGSTKEKRHGEAILPKSDKDKTKREIAATQSDTESVEASRRPEKSSKKSKKRKALAEDDREEYTEIKKAKRSKNSKHQSSADTDSDDEQTRQRKKSKKSQKSVQEVEQGEGDDRDAARKERKRLRKERRAKEAASKLDLEDEEHNVTGVKGKRESEKKSKKSKGVPGESIASSEQVLREGKKSVANKQDKITANTTSRSSAQTVASVKTAMEGHGAEQWNPEALDGGDARRSKFLRLLGAGKSGAAKSGSKTAETTRKEDISRRESELARQFEAGIRMKHGGQGKRMGLGA